MKILEHLLIANKNKILSVARYDILSALILTVLQKSKNDNVCIHCHMRTALIKIFTIFCSRKLAEK